MTAIITMTTIPLILPRLHHSEEVAGLVAVVEAAEPRLVGKKGTFI